MPAVAGFVFALLTAAAPVLAVADDQGQTLAPPARPTKVAASIELAEVNQIQDHDQQFQVEFYLYLSWVDPRLAFDRRTVGKEFQILPLDGIWLPDLELLDDLEVNVEQPKGIHVIPNGRVTYRQYYRARFGTHFDLHNFPLDRQKLELRFESAEYDTAEMILVPGKLRFEDPNRLLPDGWHLSDSSLGGGDVKDPVSGERMSQFFVALRVARDFHFYLWTIIFPVIPILAMAWTVFWMDRKEFGTQVTVGITAMLTLVAYRITIDSSLPTLSYVTRLDSFLLICEIFIFGAFLVTVVVHHYCHDSTPAMNAMADELVRVARWAPLAMLAVACGLLLVIPPSIVVAGVVVSAVGTAVMISRPSWWQRAMAAAAGSDVETLEKEMEAELHQAGAAADAEEGEHISASMLLDDYHATTLHKHSKPGRQRSSRS